MGAGARQNADEETDHRRAQGRAGALRRLFAVEQQPAGFTHQLLPGAGAFQHQQDFADREQADHHHDKLHAVGEVHTVEGKAVNAGVGVDAHRRQPQADQRRQQRFQRVLAHHAAEAGDGEHHQGEILRRAEGQRPAGQQRREQDDAADGDHRSDERADRRDGQRHAGAPLLRHRVAVQRGHDRRRIARHVEQNRRDAAAVLAADIHRRQQDQRRFGRQLEGKRQRQQDRYAVDRPEARQQADDGADEAADQGDNQVLRHQCHFEPLGQIHPGIHHRSR